MMVLVVIYSTQGAHVVHHVGRVGPLQWITAAAAVGVYRRNVI